MHLWSGNAPPQQWCAQTQPHHAHIWVTTNNLYAQCGGHS
jgi:hypothetical protein